MELLQMALPPRKISYSESHHAELKDYPIPDIDNDEVFTDLFLKSREYTMTGKLAMHALYEACVHVSDHKIPGSFVECGTWRGGSAILAGLTWKHLNHGADIWLYDTFTGMTEPTDDDVYINGMTAASFMSQYSDQIGWCYASVEDVTGNFKTAGLGDSNVRYIEGDVLETLREHLPRSISILRLDTDWYESTKLELELLYPLLSDGGILIVDDYGSWAGSRKAVDEYFAERPMPLLHRVNEQVRLGVKLPA